MGAGQVPSIIERSAVNICALVSVVGTVLMVFQQSRRRPELDRVFFVMLVVIVMLSAARVLWNTRWRLVGVGLTTVALASFTILTSMSIGLVFIPLLAAIIWVCYRCVRAHPKRRVDHAAIRVDSPS